MLRYFCRKCVCSWSNESVSVSWLSWHKLPGWSFATELYRRTSWVIKDRLLAFGWWRGSPVLGRSRRWDPNRYGHSLFGYGYCEQETRCPSSISINQIRGDVVCNMQRHALFPNSTLQPFVFSQPRVWIVCSLLLLVLLYTAEGTIYWVPQHHNLDLFFSL